MADNVVAAVEYAQLAESPTDGTIVVNKTIPDRVDGTFIFVITPDPFGGSVESFFTITTSNGFGSLTLQGITPGTYIVTELPTPGFITTTVNPQTLVVITGGTTTVNFINNLERIQTNKILVDRATGNFQGSQQARKSIPLVPLGLNLCEVGGKCQERSQNMRGNNRGNQLLLELNLNETTQVLTFSLTQTRGVNRDILLSGTIRKYKEGDKEVYLTSSGVNAPKISVEPVSTGGYTLVAFIPKNANSQSGKGLTLSFFLNDVTSLNSVRDVSAHIPTQNGNAANDEQNGNAAANSLMSAKLNQVKTKQNGDLPDFPDVQILVQSDVLGLNLGEIFTIVTAKKTYPNGYPTRDIGKCDDQERPTHLPGGLIQTYYSAKPDLKRVIKGSGNTLYAQVIKLNDTKLSDCDFYGQVIAYAAIKYVLAGLSNGGKFSASWLYAKNNAKFMRNLRNSDFADYAVVFTDPQYGLVGYDKYFRYDRTSGNGNGNGNGKKSKPNFRY